MPARSRRLTAVTAVLIAALVLASGASGASQSTSSTSALAAKLKRLFKEAGSSVSGLVVDTKTNRTLFALNATTARLPASTEKLYTTATALLEFGPNYRFATDVYGVGTTTNGTFSGTLYLKGAGDPTFGDQSFDALNYGMGGTVQALSKALAAAGVHAVKGSVLGDASIFDKYGGGPDSGYKTSSETEGELSGLSYDAGWTTSGEHALQSNPALWATQAFVKVARTEGVKIAGGTKTSTGTTPAGARLLAQVTSPTVAQLIKLTNVPSDNFLAESLLKDAGHFFGAAGSTAAGAKVVLSTLASRLGVTTSTIDGSGLSRTDRTTATQMVTMLEEMANDPSFVGSLAVAGKSGTMAQEMLGTPAVNNCRGKTGTLHDVANLVGYCTAANGDPLVFAFLLNGLRSSGAGHSLEDTMGVALAEYAGNGSGTAAPTLPVPNPSYTPAVGSSSGLAPTGTTPTTTPTTTGTGTSTTASPGNGGGGL